MHPLPPNSPVVKERKEMTVRGLLTLNGCLLLLGVLLFSGLRDWGALLGVILLVLLSVLANGFMFFKALLRREYPLALWYFLLAAGAAWAYASIKISGKIGG
ncbi:hypothetical protein [Hymenobacter terrestris]|uniref:Uncharacterized protein n=1 Tax=Hymenobacter terrestris TaxID=2748310 RepID=A0ABX2Q2G5_9BACT|nr:hypothetical protein [Hymenobacter terrestris]NVO84467.1 hypothetical protein [Hymenobacter terrestris]